MSFNVCSDASRKVIVVVGGYSSGVHLAPTLRGAGYSVIHIQPNENVYPALASSFKAHDYCANIVCKNDGPEQVTAALAELRIQLTKLGVQEKRIPDIHVIAGSEVGVVVADEIAEALKSKTRNVYEFRKARREKDAMQAALKTAAVRSIESIKTADFAKIEAWMSEKNVSFPIVIKPNASGGTDNVTLCQTKEEAKAALASVLGSIDVENKINDEALVQEYIDGEEFMVNTVSRDGVHYVTDIVRSGKKMVNGSPAYDFNELLDPIADEDLYQQLTAYIGPVLNALGLRNGAAHSEVRIDKKGPVLIETGARTMGAGIDRAAYSKALGYNHPSAAVDAYINPENLPLYLIPPRHVPVKQHTLCIFMLSPVAGKVQQAPNISAFQELPEYFSVQMASTDCELEATTSLNNCPGIMTLLGPDKKHLWEIYEMWRAAEPKIFEHMLTAPAQAPSLAENPHGMYNNPPSSSAEAATALLHNS